MSTMGTFDAFTSARLGIYAAQHGFRVTGNNISNISTVGYTRQRLDQVSFKAGAYDRYRSELDNHVGSGALVMNINQVRDPTLDVRYRDTNASYGYNNEMLEGLERIASILDEVGVGDDTNVNKKGDGRLHAQIQAVSDALRAFSKEPTKTNNDLVRNAASTLCEIINSYARELETLRVETEQRFTDQLTEINECLTNIRDLNEEIRDNEIFGDNALELRDERNRQIDKLSEYLHIKVVYSEEDVGAGKKVEKLSIYLDDDNPDTSVHTDESLLIDGIFGAQINSPKTLPMANPDYDPANATSDTDYPKAYRYLKQAVDADGVPWYDDANGNLVKVNPGDPIPPDYTPHVGGGTNDVTEAIQVDNDYYGLQISKLVDQRNRLWEGITTQWAPATSGSVASPAVYQYTITATQWADGNTVQIGGDTYTIKADGTGDITVNDANDTAKFAKFVASHLKSDDYYLSSDGAQIIFTAKKPGTVGNGANNSGPDEAPKITFTPGNGGSITLDPAAGTPAAEVKPGTETVPPSDPPASTEPYPYNPDGSQTIYTYIISDGQWMQGITHKQHTYEVTLDDNDPYGSLQATRELLTEKGEFATADDVALDENATKKRGIPYYQKALDLFAWQFASEYNKLNQGTMVDQNGDPVKSITGSIEELKALGVTLNQASGTVGGFGDGYYVTADGIFMGTTEHPVCDLDKAGLSINDTVAKAVEKIRNNVNANFAQGVTDEADLKAELENFMKLHGVDDTNASNVKITLTEPIKMGGILFSNRNDGDKTDDPPINASNITISNSWSTGSIQLVPKYDVLWNGEVNNSSQNINADHMVTMLDKDHIIDFYPTSIDPEAVGSKLFSGSFNEMFNDMCTTLGEDARKVTVNLNMYYTQVVEIDTARDSVSGVDLNDEAMNLMQYQKAYSAACRLMTVVDEALDRLINNTGVAGR